jgi:hypothetical protein
LDAVVDVVVGLDAVVDVVVGLDAVVDVVVAVVAVGLGFELVVDYQITFDIVGHSPVADYFVMDFGSVVVGNFVVGCVADAVVEIEIGAVVIEVEIVVAAAVVD